MGNYRAHIEGPDPTVGTTMLTPIFTAATPPSLGLKAIAFTVHQLCNATRSAALEHSLLRLRNDLDLKTSLRRMAGFETLRTRLGRSPRRFPASPQALLDQYLRQGGLCSISPIVDLYNHWSLHSGLSIGAHDLRAISLPVSLGLTSGAESFQALGTERAISLPAGEYAYFDAHGQVICRMEYRQCSASALRADTEAALFIIQGHQDTEPELLAQTAESLKRDLTRCCSPQRHHATNQPLIREHAARPHGLA